MNHTLAYCTKGLLESRQLLRLPKLLELLELLELPKLLKVLKLLTLGLLLQMPTTLLADEVLLSYGTGNQPHADQRNTQISLDYNFFQLDRSARSSFSIGASYMRFRTDAALNQKVEVVSIYPQLTLTPSTPAIRNFYFFVRALGPSYISHNALGERQQDKHFTFQAQVGFGYKKSIDDSNSSLLLQVSWKHLSNANLFNDNDGFDFPLVLSLGYRF